MSFNAMHGTILPPTAKGFCGKENSMSLLVDVVLILNIH